MSEKAVWPNLPADYHKDPAAHVVSIDVPQPYEEHQLLDTLHEIITQIDVERRKHQQPRTGKPEEPLKIVYRLPAELERTHNAHKTAAQYSARQTDAEGLNQGPVYHLYISDLWQQWPRIETRVFPQRMVTTGGINHPLRPPKSVGKVYSRQIQSHDHISFSLEVADANRHLHLFHEWHNSDRVNAFWGERGSLEKHRAYMLKQDADPHVTPVIGYFNDEAFGYFELYWAKEDSVGTYANATNWDAGFHALVGNQQHRGPQKVEIWINCITHYLFLRDARTQRVMLEPRVDNAVFIKYLTQHGYSVEKEFNFPHKRAALVSITREKFFESQGVVP